MSDVRSALAGASFEGIASGKRSGLARDDQLSG